MSPTRRVETYRDGELVDATDVEVPVEVDNAERLRARAGEAIEALEDADARWSSLTAAERTAASRLAIRVVAKLARLILGRLEAAP